MAAPKGNSNAKKGTLWADAIRKAVMRAAEGDTEGRRKLDKLAEVTVAAGLAGDMAAIKEIGDRLDGKATQAIEAQVDASVTVEIVRFADTAT